MAVDDSWFTEDLLRAEVAGIRYENTEDVARKRVTSDFRRTTEIDGTLVRVSELMPFDLEAGAEGSRASSGSISVSCLRRILR
jgi:hypothetical protein